MSKIDKNEHDKIIKIKFENFFENFNTESKKLCKSLEIKYNTKHKFNFKKYTKKFIQVQKLPHKKGNKLYKQKLI